MRRLVILAAIFAAFAPGTAAAQEKDIVDIASGDSRFDTLTSLLDQAGLVDTLKQKGPYTVFAPTDRAFAMVPKATLDALAQDPDQLRAVLTYHVSKRKLTAAKVVKRKSIKTLNGQRLRVRVRKDKVFVNRARVTTADVEASNGVIHVINKVLIPR